jgi:aspartyl aminopeptidase
VFDNEEVGSTTKQGADSTFLSDVLRRITLALCRPEEDYYTLLANSFMLSADNAHAVHPNHPEKYDMGNRTFMNGGVVIKHNARQKYTTDAASDAVFSEILRAAGVPVQHFANRSDVPGGSTLGSIANSHASMNTVDIGLAQLAMHSAYETAGTADPDHMIRALTAFHETDVRMTADGVFDLR